MLRAEYFVYGANIHTVEFTSIHNFGHFVLVCYQRIHSLSLTVSISEGMHICGYPDFPGYYFVVQHSYSNTSSTVINQYRNRWHTSPFSPVNACYILCFTFWIEAEEIKNV